MKRHDSKMKIKLLSLLMLMNFACSISFAQAIDAEFGLFSSHLPKSTTSSSSLLVAQGYKDILGAKSFATSLRNVKGDSPGSLRGAKEIQLYRKISPSVVLVVTDSGLGSGSFLNAKGEVLTNWHVIQGAKEVGVIFKPKSEGRVVGAADIVRAEIIRYDEVSDLALLRILEVPKGVVPISFGSLTTDALVGADVHAIGHPSGESWTYTKGVVSQVRRDYKWTSESNKAHQATVIQTQTPINPGNSGGPLLTDDGRLIGVNSFKSKGEGLNFAVSIDDVQRFLSSSVNRFAVNVQPQQSAPQAAGGKSCSEDPKQVYSGPNKEKNGTITGYDTDCDGVANFEIRTPNDSTKAITWVFDQNGDGKPDVVVFDYKRSNYFELSIHDVDFDGKWDLVGLHLDGKLKPTRYEKYDAYMAKK